MKYEEYQEIKENTIKLFKIIGIIIIGIYIIVLQIAIIDIWIKSRNTERMLSDVLSRVAGGEFVVCPEPVNPGTGAIYKKYHKVFNMLLKGYKL